MPEHEQLPPEDLDRAPAGSESLQTTNDEFLGDLGEKLDQPLTGHEIGEQMKANRDWAGITPDIRSTDGQHIDETLDQLNQVMETEVEKAQLAKLDQDSRDVLEEIRGIYHKIGDRVRHSQGNEELTKLREEARETWDNLHRDYTAYTSGRKEDDDPVKFSSALINYLEQFNDIESRVFHE